MRNPIREQNNGIVSIDGTFRRLPILNAYVNSSSVYWFRTGFPYERLVLKVGNEDKTRWIAICKATYHASCGMYRVYVSPKYFPRHCETAYQVSAIDDKGSKSILGEGILRVYSSAIDEQERKIDCKAKFPDGEWHVITVSEDECGAPVFTVGEVAEEPPEDEVELYAWDNSRGYYFKVVAQIDEVGVRILALDQTPHESGEETFARDEATGFFRRIEGVKDDAGVETLVVGEEKK